MAYPEPTPELKGKKALEFQQRLESFKLSAAQKVLYKDARKIYKDIDKKSSR